MVFGIDTTDEAFVEHYADALVRWVEYRVTADGQLTSGLEDAIVAAGAAQAGLGRI
jgi:hypothetical protein